MFSAAKTIGIQSFNLTMPHKEDILPYLSRMTPEAERCHSVNSVRIRDGRLEGHSTDGLGFRQSLAAFSRDFPGQTVTILGAGGAAKSIAMTAAETGHLVISTLHTLGAVNTIDRIVDAFPPSQQGQIRVQLSMVLQAVVSQQLISCKDGRVVPAFEIMLCNPAIRTMIRESKTHQIDSAIFSSSGEGMVGMDTSLMRLYEQGMISSEEALLHSASPDLLKKKNEALIIK